MEINNFRGDVNGISATKEALFRIHYFRFGRYIDEDTPTNVNFVLRKDFMKGSKNVLLIQSTALRRANA